MKQECWHTVKNNIKIEVKQTKRKEENFFEGTERCQNTLILPPPHPKEPSHTEVLYLLLGGRLFPSHLASGFPDSFHLATVGNKIQD